MLHKEISHTEHSRRRNHLLIDRKCARTYSKECRIQTQTARDAKREPDAFSFLPANHTWIPGLEKLSVDDINATIEQEKWNFSPYNPRPDFKFKPLWQIVSNYPLDANIREPRAIANAAKDIFIHLVGEEPNATSLLRAAEYCILHYDSPFSPMITIGKRHSPPSEPLPTKERRGSCYFVVTLDSKTPRIKIGFTSYNHTNFDREELRLKNGGAFNPMDVFLFRVQNACIPDVAIKKAIAFHEGVYGKRDGPIYEMEMFMHHRLWEYNLMNCSPASGTIHGPGGEEISCGKKFHANACREWFLVPPIHLRSVIQELQIKYDAMIQAHPQNLALVHGVKHPFANIFDGMEMVIHSVVGGKFESNSFENTRLDIQLDHDPFYTKASAHMMQVATEVEDAFEASELVQDYDLVEERKQYWHDWKEEASSKPKGPGPLKQVEPTESMIPPESAPMVKRQKY